MEIAKEILQIIEENSEAVLFGSDLNPNDVMYAHGDRNTFEGIIADIEEQFSCMIHEDQYPTDIGEMSTASFVEATVKIIQGEEDSNGLCKS